MLKFPTYPFNIREKSKKPRIRRQIRQFLRKQMPPKFALGTKSGNWLTILASHCPSGVARILKNQPCGLELNKNSNILGWCTCREYCVMCTMVPRLLGNKLFR